MRERVNRPTRSRSRDQKQFLNESDHILIRLDTQLLDRNWDKTRLVHSISHRSAKTYVCHVEKPHQPADDAALDTTLHLMRRRRIRVGDKPCGSGIWAAWWIAYTRLWLLVKAVDFLRSSSSRLVPIGSKANRKRGHMSCLLFNSSTDQ
jgi:hypothetical protein